MADEAAARERPKKNYGPEKDVCKKFLMEYTSDIGDGAGSNRKYFRQLHEISNRQRTVLRIELDDVLGWGDEPDFVERIQQNATRYLDLFAKAADEALGDEALLPTTPQRGSAASTNVAEDTIDVLRRQREQQQSEADTVDDRAPDPQDAFPASLMRRFEVFLTPATKQKAVPLRNIRAPEIGRLVRVRGVVTRVSDVKPMVSVATYTCDACGFEIYQEVRGRQFMPLVDCPTKQCKTNRQKGKLHLQTRGSKFVRFQELKIQEMPDQVPIGHIPRTMTVHCRGDTTRQCTPGDDCVIEGIFLPTPFTGFRGVRAGLIADTYLECMHLVRQKKSYAELGQETTPEIEAEIDEACEDPNIFSKLARSLAPEIYGHEDVKKALLLMLVGGVTKAQKDGMKIRGDINVCLMGDPGVAKSQLLKHVASVAPRGVYTTGKGSSGVGLTAAVVRDPVTQDMMLEGGALVLADKGICCIDEFDKMDDTDRTAIHEVMEQQTVSIAKAGVTTTLNARTAILAAANPLYGRYNKRYSPSENINLPAALLSRFDLMFLILDKADRETDVSLARHITHVHRFSAHPDLDFEAFSPKFIRAYISQARKVEPCVPPKLSNFIVEAYVDMRDRDALDAQENGALSMMTARQLLSILRLSQGLARLRFDDEVREGDVEEAIRLVSCSKSSLEDDDEPAGGANAGADAISRVYAVLRSYHTKHKRDTINYSDIEPIVLSKGLTQQHLLSCLDEYEKINVLQLNPARTRITFVESESE